ncbi:MAG: 4-Hydroxy-2-oxoglutarate aldolase [Hyphomicrobiales bacterium]|nr:4-Hydroxy-2-oxoglutarate aldolase [Hyphomicrobiales bacterium]
MTSHSESPLRLLEPARLVPLIEIAHVEDAAPLARAFVSAGLRTLEIALRTKNAPHAIAEIRAHAPEAIVGAGNVMTPHDLHLAREAGARFALSPGSTPALLDAAASMDDFPFVPGVATASELMFAMSKGFHVVKFFPAAGLGGPATLRSMGSAFPHARFVPTGGTSEEDLDAWLAQPNVVAVGGSWLAPREDIARRDWDAIRRRAEAAVARHRALRA